MLFLAAILIAGLAIASNLTSAALDNDAAAYASRTHHMFNGDVPYLDFEFEHLPLAVVPMLVIGAIERIVGVSYAVVLWAVMGVVLFGIGLTVNRLGRRLGVDGAAIRWLKISWAILPLIAFRLDAVSVLLALLALVLTIEGEDARSGWALGAAIAAKGWPIVMAAVDWWRHRYRRAITTVIATAAGALVLTTLPLFRSGREFFGVHIETVTGAITGLARLWLGTDPQVATTAGASYVAVGTWAVVVNAAIGLAIGLSALRALRTSFDWRRATDLIGTLAIAVMLLSPLLSAQFVFWITPFAALTSSKKVRVGATASAILTGVFVTFWFSGYLWWWAVIVARNIALVWTGWVWSLHVCADTEAPARAL